MDLRSVLSCLPISLIANDSINSSINFFGGGKSFQAIQEILTWLTQEKLNTKINVNQISLLKCDPWIIEDEIYHPSKNYFKIKGIQCSTSFPGKFSWYQPIVEPCEAGLIAFIIKRINGSIHFLVQAKLEAGCFNFSEIAPTVQCLTGNLSKSSPPIFFNLIDSVPREAILYDQFQSEEGGRFMRESNRNVVILVDNSFAIPYGCTHTWVSYAQLKHYVYLEIW